MLINFVLILFGVVLLFALVFSAWMLWGFLRYGAPLVSTSQKIAKRMIELSDIQSGNIIYDLGCGTGAILFEVANLPPTPSLQKREGLKCVGYDLVRPAIWWARIKNALLKKNIQFHSQDFFTANLSDADVIFCYLLPPVMDRIYTEKWNELKAGCRIVSHGFPILPLQPTQVVQVGKGNIYVYEK